MSDTKPINDGGFAFPIGPFGDSFTFEDGKTTHQFPGWSGMTLRDYFAAQAIGPLMADLLPKFAAEVAYEIADAMIAEREKP